MEKKEKKVVNSNEKSFLDKLIDVPSESRVPVIISKEEKAAQRQAIKREKNRLKEEQKINKKRLKKGYIVKEEEIVRYFDVDLAQGLTSEIVEQRNKDGLSNVTDSGKGKTVPQIIISNVFTFFNLLSSRIITGNYQVTDNKLTLTEYDGTNYVFTVKSDRIVFLSTTAKHSYLEKGLTYYPEKKDYENMQAAVYYGFSSSALFTDNAEGVKELYDGYYNMKTELTEAELDFTSGFYVGVGDVSFFMDKYGWIKLNDADYTVRDTADSISYDRLKQIYNDPSLMMGEDWIYCIMVIE